MILRVKRLVLCVKGSVNPFYAKSVLRVKQKYYYILMNCFTRKTNGFTRKTLVSANRVRIHLLRVKPIVLSRLVPP